MAIEFEPEGETIQDLATELLLSDVSCFLSERRAEGEMRRMDEQVAEVITLEEHAQYQHYKQFCLNQLAQFNQTCGGNNGALQSAIERGFLLGYWFALQHNQPQPLTEN